MKTNTEKFNKRYNKKLFKNQDINKFNPGDHIKIILTTEPDTCYSSFWSLGGCFDNWDKGKSPKLFSIGEVVDVRTFKLDWAHWLPKDKRLVPMAIVEIEDKCYIVNERCLEIIKSV